METSEAREVSLRYSKIVSGWGKYKQQGADLPQTAEALLALNDQIFSLLPLAEAGERLIELEERLISPVSSPGSSDLICIITVEDGLFSIEVWDEVMDEAIVSQPCETIDEALASLVSLGTPDRD